MSKTWNATGPLIKTYIENLPNSRNCLKPSNDDVTLILNMSVYLSPASPNDVTLILNMSVYLSPASPNDVTSILNISVYLTP